MPPSGFSQKAINGLLEFVRSSYENTLARYQGKNLREKEALEGAVGYLDGIVRTSVPLAMNGTVSPKGIEGLARFVTTNFRDLVAEIESGKKTEGQAMEEEIADIGRYLAEFHI